MKDLAEKAKGYGIHAVTVDGNDVIAVHAATKHAVERARRGKGVHFIEVKTYRRKGHAEHDDQSYQPKDEIEQWARDNDPVDRFIKQLLENSWAEESELTEIERAAKDEIDQATDACVNEPLPLPESALPGVYAHPEAADRLWFRGL